MAGVTGYAVFFGTLRSLGISNTAFIIATLYITTIVYSQWALFGGWRPYAASFLTSGSLFVLVFLADFQLCPAVLGFAFLIGGLIGLGAAGFTDMWLLLSEIMRGAVPKAWASTWPPLVSPEDHNQSGSNAPSRTMRIVVFILLVGVFFLAMLWGRIAGQESIATTLHEHGRIWRLPFW